jgi:hypothetical protein
MAAHPEVLAYLVEGAKKRGIDPAVVVKAFNHEGLAVFDPNKPDRGGDEGSSFGPYQLHYKGMSKSMPNAGMGDDFTAATGLDARDPSTWRQQTDYVLDHLAGGGTWKPWMGAAAEGIYGRTGLPGGDRFKGKAPDTAGEIQPRVSGPVEAAGGGFGADTGPQLYDDAPSDGRQDLAEGMVAGAFPDKPKKPVTWKDRMRGAAKGFGAALSDMGGNMAAPMSLPSQIPTTMTPGQMVSPIDPQQADTQRQQLAAAMARLNSGRLY